MGKLRALVKNDPSGVLTLVNVAAGAAAAALGHPEFTPVFVAVAALVLGLRTQVTPTTKADKALTAVALDVAKNLTVDNAGAAGEITGPAAGIIDAALEAVKAGGPEWSG